MDRVCPRCGSIAEDAQVLCRTCGAASFVEPMDGPTPVAVGDYIFDTWTLGPADAEPIILLHGFPESAQSWALVAPHLVHAGFRVVAPHQRGYSPRARPTDVAEYGTDHLVADVVGLLDALDITSAHIVGHDWGAAVAWPLAAHYPDRVASLVAVSVPHLAAYGRALRDDADQQARASYIGVFRQPGKAEDLLLDDDAARLRAMFGDVVPPDLVDAHVELLSDRAAMTAALNWYRAMQADLGELEPVRVPTTYVWSTADIAIGRAGAQWCADHVEGPYTFVELAGATHWIGEERPIELADAIIERARSVS